MTLERGNKRNAAFEKNKAVLISKIFVISIMGGTSNGHRGFCRASGVRVDNCQEKNSHSTTHDWNSNDFPNKLLKHITTGVKEYPNRETQ